MTRNRLPSITSVFVLGSTSVVAQAICTQLAELGCKRFHLLARDSVRNLLFAADLEERFGSTVTTEEIELSRCSSIDFSRTPAVGDFDLYLITAGSLGDAELARGDVTEALRITATNYSGLIPWITAIATPTRLASQARLWVFSSVAADRGRPSNYHYGAAKAALTSLCEGLLLRCYRKPFSVRIIKAGFIATPMSFGKAPSALCVSPEAVARALLRRPNKRGIEYLPWWWSPLMSLIRLLPVRFASNL